MASLEEQAEEFNRRITLLKEKIESKKAEREPTPQSIEQRRPRTPDHSARKDKSLHSGVRTKSQSRRSPSPRHKKSRSPGRAKHQMSRSIELSRRHRSRSIEHTRSHRSRSIERAGRHRSRSIERGKQQRESSRGYKQRSPDRKRKSQDKKSNKGEHTRTEGQVDLQWIPHPYWPGQLISVPATAVKHQATAIPPNPHEPPNYGYSPYGHGRTNYPAPGQLGTNKS